MTGRGVDEIGIASVLVEAVREAVRRTPAPRDLPFFGLDHPPGCGPRLLDRMADTGIFRHYSHVLEVGAALGGPGRWLARARGCRVVGLSSRTRTRAAAVLDRAAGHAGDIRRVAGPREAMPFGEAVFTHVWLVETGLHQDVWVPVLVESLRVLRPAGWLTVQERVDPTILESMVSGARRLGFAEADSLEVEDLREADSQVATLLTLRVEERLGASLERTPRAPGGRLVQILAQKPA